MRFKSGQQDVFIQVGDRRTNNRNLIFESAFGKTTITPSNFHKLVLEKAAVGSNSQAMNVKVTSTIDQIVFKNGDVLTGNLETRLFK